MIYEQLMGVGSWSLTLREDVTPASVWTALDPAVGGFGHVLIVDGRPDPLALGDDGMLGRSLYTGVYLGTSARNQIGGMGLVGWLGDADGLGHVFEASVDGTDPDGTYTQGTFRAWIKDALNEPDSIAVGTLTDIAGTYTAEHLFLNSRQIIDLACDYFGGEYRVNPDGTLDAGPPSALFVDTPEAVLMWEGGGRDGPLSGFQSDRIDLTRDLEDYTSRVVVLTNSGTRGEAGGADGTYKDLFGNAMIRKRLVQGSNVSADNADTVASQQLGRFDDVRRSYALSTSEWNLRGRVTPGDALWVYDPRADAELADFDNEVQFRGQTIFPMKMRVQAIRWPVRDGYGVFFRTPDGDYLDLTDYVVDESGAATIEVGATRRPMSGGSTSTMEQQQVQQGALGRLKYAAVQTAVNNVTTATDLSDLDVDVKVGPNRIIRVDVKIRLNADNAARAVVAIFRDGTQESVVGDVLSHSAQQDFVVSGSATLEQVVDGTVNFVVRLTPISGSWDVPTFAADQNFIAVYDEGPIR